MNDWHSQRQRDSSGVKAKNRSQVDYSRFADIGDSDDDEQAQPQRPQSQLPPALQRGLDEAQGGSSQIQPPRHANPCESCTPAPRVCVTCRRGEGNS